MKIEKKNRSEIFDGIEDHSEDRAEELYDRAVAEVTSDTSEKKRKRNYQKYYADRPEHLRKPVIEMSPEEKREYYLWKAGETISDEQKPVEFETGEVVSLFEVVNVYLKYRAPRWSLTNEEIGRGAEVTTKLLNKYAVMAAPYVVEINFALFWLSYYVSRKIFGNGYADSGQAGDGKNNTGENGDSAL